MSDQYIWRVERQAELDEFKACHECGGTDLHHEEEFMRPWFTEHRCNDCGWIGRGLS